jgi:hypothetical protein
MGGNCQLSTWAAIFAKQKLSASRIENRDGRMRTETATTKTPNNVFF